MISYSQIDNPAVPSLRTLGYLAPACLSSGWGGEQSAWLDLRGQGFLWEGKEMSVSVALQR